MPAKKIRRRAPRPKAPRAARAKKPPTQPAPVASAQPPVRLRWCLDPQSLGFASTADLEPRGSGVHGQARALEALRLGTELYAPGYNVFCVGLEGANRLEVVQGVIAALQSRCMPAPDRCFVMNFGMPDAPRHLELPRGRARGFRRDLDDLFDQLVKHLGLVFEEDRFTHRVRQVTEDHARREREILSKLHELARGQGFAVTEVEGPSGATLDVALRLEGLLVSIDDVERAVRDVRAGQAPGLVEDVADDAALVPQLVGLDVPGLREIHADLLATLRRASLEARRLATSLQKQVQALEREEALVVVQGVVDELASHYSDQLQIVAHLESVKTDVLDHLALFRKPGLRPVRPEEDVVAGALMDEESGAPEGWADAHARYRVNIICDNLERAECPVLIENNPTSRNLFGAVVRVVDRAGRLLADHRSIRPGSLLAADGGYLVIDAAALLSEPDAWRQLRSCLLTGSVDLRDSGGDRGQPPMPLLRPDPIPLNVKVVLVGDEEAYDLLDAHDPDFRHTFKVRAEFDWLVERTQEAVRDLGRELRRLVDEERLLHFDASAVAALAEHAARLAEQAGFLLCRMDLLSDVARQAVYHARQEGADSVRAVHVLTALAAADRRSSLGAERLRGFIHEGRILINTTGRKVGQLNALAVRSSTDHSFGHPVRMTAVVGHGTSGVINIEREARLSGNIHDKGMLIVEGYLSFRYAEDFPLAFSASLAFEQSYAEIDGDSASSAEVYALLSALAGLPLSQGIAVSSSVNQVGEIQPIGGANEKVEGFFDACVGLAGSVAQLPGDQGVILPRANLGDLMLRHDVLAACEAGKFHVHGIDHVDQGIAILSGVPAGTPNARGTYPVGSVHARVLERLRNLSRGPDHQRARRRGKGAVRTHPPAR